MVTNSDVYEWYKKQDGLNFAVGEKFEYSNGGYSLLALLITEASGQSLPEFSREHIFIPAGMSETSIIEYPSNVKNQAISYGEWPFFDNVDFNTGNALQGEDGVYTSLNDMERWINAMENNTLVSPSTTWKIFSRVNTNDGRSVDYCYGWEWSEYKTIEFVGHSGSWVGFNTFIVHVPDRKAWFLAFSNTMAISSADAVFRMADYYFDT